MNTVDVAIHPERPIVRNDGVTELDLVVEVACSASNEEVGRTGPMNLCLVIDRSGSMRGEKLETAKSSAKNIFGRLGREDLLTVVVFDDRANVIVNPQTPANEVVGRLTGINPGGMTNLSLGWFQGLLELQTYMGESHRNRLLLLSDGQANSGETKRSAYFDSGVKAREVGITASTIGIGLDFQEDLLEAISASSGGRFWNIAESDIEDIVEEEFQGALTVLIDRPRITLSLPDGCRISRELNSLRKVSGRYRFRPLQGNDTFNFAVRVEIDPEQITNEQIIISSVLTDGDLEIGSTQISLRTGSSEDVAASPVHALVRSIVQQFELSTTDEMMLEAVDADRITDLRQMLTAEIARLETEQEGWRSASPADLGISSGRMSMEMGHLQHDLVSKGAMADCLDLITPHRGDPDVERFLTLARKNMMREGNRMKMRRLRPTRWDTDAPLILEALALADSLSAAYPDDAERIERVKETLRGYLENL